MSEIERTYFAVIGNQLAEIRAASIMEATARACMLYNRGTAPNSKWSRDDSNDLPTALKARGCRCVMVTDGAGPGEPDWSIWLQHEPTTAQRIAARFGVVVPSTALKPLEQRDERGRTVMQGCLEVDGLLVTQERHWRRFGFPDGSAILMHVTGWRVEIVGRA